MENSSEIPETTYYYDLSNHPDFVIHSVLVQNGAVTVKYLADKLIEVGFDKSSACEHIDKLHGKIIELDEYSGHVIALNQWMRN